MPEENIDLVIDEDVVNVVIEEDSIDIVLEETDVVFIELQEGVQGERGVQGEQGIPGRDGLDGAAGPAGPAGHSEVDPIVYIQNTPSKVWTIAHPFMHTPYLKVFDSNGNRVFVDEEFPEPGLVVLRFAFEDTGMVQLL